MNKLEKTISSVKEKIVRLKNILTSKDDNFSNAYCYDVRIEIKKQKAILKQLEEDYLCLNRTPQNCFGCNGKGCTQCDGRGYTFKNTVVKNL